MLLLGDSNWGIKPQGQINDKELIFNWQSFWFIWIPLQISYPHFHWLHGKSLLNQNYERQKEAQCRPKRTTLSLRKPKVYKLPTLCSPWYYAIQWEKPLPENSLKDTECSFRETWNLKWNEWEHPDSKRTSCDDVNSRPSWKSTIHYVTSLKWC